MTKDYAPKSTKLPSRRAAVAKQARQAKRAFSPGSFLGGAVCGAIVLMVIDHVPGLFTAEPTQADETAAETQPEHPLTYEFIHRLPSEVVRTHVDPYEPPPPGAAADPAEPSEAHVYLLQAASFLRSDDAEAMRAELLLEGMQATVSVVPRPGGRTWHRVLVGPFPGRAEMTRALSTLRGKDIPALPLVRKTPVQQGDGQSRSERGVETGVPAFAGQR